MPLPLLRQLIGIALRRARLRQGRTLREVAATAGVSIAYLSELERGRKEASSEVLAAICRALGWQLGDLLDDVQEELQQQRSVQQVRPAGQAVPAGRRQPYQGRLCTIGPARPGHGTTGPARSPSRIPRRARPVTHLEQPGEPDQSQRQHQSPWPDHAPAVRFPAVQVPLVTISATLPTTWSTIR